MKSCTDSEGCSNSEAAERAGIHPVAGSARPEDAANAPTISPPSPITVASSSRNAATACTNCRGCTGLPERLIVRRACSERAASLSRNDCVQFGSADRPKMESSASRHLRNWSISAVTPIVTARLRPIREGSGSTWIMTASSWTTPAWPNPRRKSKSAPRSSTASAALSASLAVAKYLKGMVAAQHPARHAVQEDGSLGRPRDAVERVFGAGPVGPGARHDHGLGCAPQNLCDISYCVGIR